MIGHNLKFRGEAFILLEVLISAFIICGAIASGMYLYRIGFQIFDRVKEDNLILSKVPQAVNYLTYVADLDKNEEVYPLGQKVTLKWKSEMLEKRRIEKYDIEVGTYALHELLLYHVTFTLASKNKEKTYTLYVLRYRPIGTPGSSDID